MDHLELDLQCRDIKELGRLLRAIVLSGNRAAVHRVLEKIHLFDLTAYLRVSNAEPIRWLIWWMLLADDEKLGGWVERVDRKIWTEKVLGAPPLEKFWLLWNLYQANADIGGSIICGPDVGPRIVRELGVSPTLSVRDLPLLGLLATHGLKLDHKPLLPSLQEVSDEVIKDYLDVSLLIFTIKGMMEVHPAIAQELHGFIPASSIRKLQIGVDQFPLPRARLYLQNMLSAPDLRWLT